MSRRAVIFVTSLALLTLVNFMWPTPPSPLTSSTFGKAGSGHGAVYDLLTEAGLARGRSFESGRRLEGDDPIWWIDPLGVCDGRIARSGDADVLDAEDVQWPAAGWIRSGGMAVVFLQPADPGGLVLAPQDTLVSCDAIAGIGLPRRDRLDVAAEEAGAEAAAAAAEVAAEAERVVRAEWTVQGAVLRAPRRLVQPKIYAFEESLDWEVLATVSGHGEGSFPFALGRDLGEGRLVVVADSGFTHNGWLDQADAAPLVVDWVSALGPPRFDEREHGFVPETSAFRFIARSAALPVFLGLMLLGVLYAWRGNALPSRSVAEFDPAAPTLDNYLTSMASLYARTRDHGRVLARYRDLTASRLKRHFGLPQEVSPRVLVERIEGDPRRARDPGRGAGGDPSAAARKQQRLSSLIEPPEVASAAELDAAVRDLDELVLEVTR